MAERKKTINPIREHWIYWRWIGERVLNLSYIQGIMESPNGTILLLSDGLSWTNYPTIILRKEIFIAQITERKNEII